MTDQRGRYRTDFSAVAASAGRMAASAITAASTAMETAARAADEARDKAARRRDPKVAHQRSITQARYAVNSWAATTSTSAVVAVGGFAAAAPVVGGTATAVTALVAVPAGYAVRKLRRLRRTPPPPRTYARRTVPGRSSALHDSVRALADAEQEFLALMSVLTRSGALPPDALSELDDDAEASADAIVSYAEQLGDLERVVAGGGSSAAYLRETFEEGLSSLDEGVEAYREMVRSAATTVAAARRSLGSPARFDELSTATPRLRETAERLRAWAYGIAALPPVPDPHSW
ncbi:phage shock envelope stress response protein PspM [Tsukamurella paurometabola]|uniref:Uncharacterized protein n=1 Tax=Tsukamurella paurometabola TaxID=2061 RepID=A0A3P8L5T3_TSUPA|nr:hypothetical protein [Tsukamurella paurometabola]UEA83996.1 hypothetical protein LK411_03930 [Tsukamurella paurometabola]VDR41155.1 Uncharacterised protein [Tsukamurella paurometabola]